MYGELGTFNRIRYKFISLSAPSAFPFELFLPWIRKLMLAYLEQKELENDLFTLTDTKYPNAYYTKK